MPKDPTPQEREQIRRLAPRAGLKRMIVKLREEVDETRAEVDQLAYTLLELRSGVPASYRAIIGAGGGIGGGMGGGMGGMGGGMGPGMRFEFGPWFGSIGQQGGYPGMGGMR